MLLQVKSTILARKKIIEENNLTDKPNQIINFDEAGWSQKEGPSRQLGIILSNMKTGVVEHRTKRDHITIAMMVSAAGETFPPMVITPSAISEDSKQQV